MDFPILSDPDKKAASAYGVINDKRSLPARHTFYIGEDGKLMYIDTEVKAATHGADVTKKLTELGVPEKT